MSDNDLLYSYIDSTQIILLKTEKSNMKKLLLFIVVTLTFVACRDSKEIQFNSINLSVKNSDWVENVDNQGLNRYYSCHFNMPEISSTVFNSGSVIAYIIVNNSTSQQNLPYVRHFENAKGVLWTQTIDFDYSEGRINIYVTNSDFAVDPPSAMDFRVVVL